MTHLRPVILAADAPAWADRALSELARLDPLIAAIPEQAGTLPWRRREAGFPGLLRGLCGQMISNQAATAIWVRLSTLPGALSPDGLLALSDEGAPSYDHQLAAKLAGLGVPITLFTRHRGHLETAGSLATRLAVSLEGVEEAEGMVVEWRVWWRGW